jgi:hypothetical protein
MGLAYSKLSKFEKAIKTLKINKYRSGIFRISTKAGIKIF